MSAAGARFPTIGALFEETARRHSDAVAVVGPVEELSYRTLLERSGEVRDRLRRHGAGRGRVVATLLPKHDLRCVIATLAIWRCGATLLSIDPALPTARRDALLAQAGARLVVCSGSDGIRLDVVDASSAPAAATDPLDAAYLIYTSGSTGTPKPVAVSCRALLAIHSAWRQVYDLAAKPRTYVQIAGLSFDVFVADIARTVLSGGRLVLCPTETVLDPPALLDLVTRTGVDSVELTPSVLRLLTGWAQRHGARLDFDLMVVGGEQWSTRDLAALREVTGPGTRVVNTYGITETAVDTTYLNVTDVDPEAIGPVVPIGRPFPGVVTAVLDAERRPVPPGRTGELHVAGPTLADGYLGLPGETAQRFVPSTIGGSALMYRTGDLVRADRAGRLVVVGRVDDEVKLHGVRVHPGEVESVLATAGARFDLDAAAVAVDRAAASPRLLGFVATGGRPAPPDIADRLRAAVSERLPRAMVPARFEVVERFPLTPSGKVDRIALVAEAARRTDPASGTAIPADPVMAAVHAAWHDALGGPPSGPDDDLFASGADSLAAARVAAGIGERLDVRMSVADVLAARTAGALAELAATAEREPAVPPDGDAPRSPEFPATTAQSALWMLHRLDRADPTYHLPTVLEIDGDLDVAALHRALATVVQRHEALRCAFFPGREGALVRIADHCAVPLPVERVDAADVTARIGAIVAEPFDLARAPLLHARLLHPGPGRHILVLVVHHIVFDGYSEALLLDELGACYTAERTGRAAALPPARPLPQSASQPSTASLAFWRRRLAGWAGPVLLTEPVAAPAGAAPHRVRTRLPEHGTRTLRRLASTLRTTPYTVMLAALAVLIARRGGSDDLVLGTPLGARTTETARRSIGFQVASVPVRVGVPPRATFTDIVARVRRELIDAFAYADAGLPDIVAELGLSGSGRRNPLFTQWFNWLGEPPAPPRLDDLRVQLAEPPVSGALFDASWYVTDTSDGLVLELVTAADIFDGDETTELFEQYVLLLEQLAASPSLAVGDADLRTSRAEQVLPSESADLRTNPPDLMRRLQAALARNRDAPAVSGPDGTWTAAELAQHADRLAARLWHAGVRDGDVVPIHTGRCGALVVAVLAVLRAGAVFTLLDAHHPPLRLAAQAAATEGPTGITTGPAPPPEVRAARAAWLPVGDRNEGAVETPPVARDDAGLPGYVLFTSGTSGRPRGVIGGTAALANFLTWYCREHRVEARDRVAMLSGLSHDPLLRDILVPLVSGAGCWIPPDELLLAPRRLLDWLRDSAVTIAHLTPTLAGALATAADVCQVPSLRLVTCAGEILTGASAAAIRSWAPHARIVNGYGATETPQLIATCDADVAAAPGARLPVGRGVPGAQLLVRSGTGRMAAIGEPGEVVVRSPYLVRVAAGEPLAADADPVPDHRRYRTGDLGRYRADGTVVILGRAGGDRRSVQGHRVNLGEIDAALRALPGVLDAAADVRQGPDGSALVIAYIVRDSAGPGDERIDAALAGYRTRLRAVLPAYCVPTRLVEVTALPRTRNGKIDRAALPSPEGALTAFEPAPWPGASDTVRQVVHAVWRELLRRDQVPLGTNLFDLGASSLTMLTAHSRIERALDTTLAPMALFQFPTIDALADHLRDADAGGQTRRPARARRATGLLDRRRAARRLAWQQEDFR